MRNFSDRSQYGEDFKLHVTFAMAASITVEWICRIPPLIVPGLELVGMDSDSWSSMLIIHPIIHLSQNKLQYAGLQKTESGKEEN